MIGIDASSSVIEIANTNQQKRQIKNCHFITCDALKLPFDDGSFDVVHSHMAVVHLPDALQGMKEMHRVCRAGGFVACREGDWFSTCFYPDPTGHLQRWIDETAKVIVDGGADIYQGRKMITTALQAGFHTGNIMSSMTVNKYSSIEERAFWGSTQAHRLRETEMGERMIRLGILSPQELEEIAQALEEWGKSRDGLYYMVMIEILCKK